MNSCSQTVKRESSIELFRILAMLLIIMHHYVVNSGLSTLAAQDYSAGPAAFLFSFGAWGKMGINCFVLITGYFMCRQTISARKFIKLLAEAEFYNILFFLLFTLSGYEPFSIQGALATLFPVTNVTTGFLSCYLIFYFCIPFLNILIKNINRKNHIRLLVLCLFIYTFLGSLSMLNSFFRTLRFGVSMNYVSWFIVLYFLGAYIRIYPPAGIKNAKAYLPGLLIAALASLFSVILLTYLKALPPDSPLAANRVIHMLRDQDVHYFLADSNKILAVLTSVYGFLFFKNLHLGYHRRINAMGASTFGVLMIHANSDTMRQWLWRDLLRNPEMFSSPYLPVHAVLSVLGIFIICVLLDRARIRFVERPFFRWWDRHYDHWAERFCQREKAWCRRLHIEE